MQNNILRIASFGDIVGKSGTDAFCRLLPKYKRENNIDFVTVNAENSSDRDGTEYDDALRILSHGADVITGGNHTLTNRTIFPLLEESEFVLRPVNFQPLCPGRGYTVVSAATGIKILVINVSGQVFMPSCDNPFFAVDRVLSETKGQYDIAVMDIHAEATSEKIALGHYFDGRIQCVYGTHTHIPTADETVLDYGTGYITDIGMCGVYENTVLGVDYESIIKRFTSDVRDKPKRGADGKVTVSGVLFDVDLTVKKTVNIQRIKIQEKTK